MARRRPVPRRASGGQTVAGTGRRRRLAIVAAAVGAVGLVAVGAVALATRGSGESGDLYFTTYQHTALYKVAFTFRSGRPQFGAQQLVTTLPGADGVVFEPDGHAVVGGQNLGTVAEVDPATGEHRSVASGCPGAFLLAVDPATSDVFTAGLPGPLCVMPVDPLRPGVPVPVHGDDAAITSVAFDGGGHAFYTTGGSFGPGNFGSIDAATGATTRFLTDIAAGHGMTYDAFTGTLYLFGGQSIMQIDPRHPQQVLSSMSVPGVQFDQGTTDGQGHLFAASNFGQLVVVDDRLSGRLGNPRNQVTMVHLHANLDDIAPLVGPGAATGTGRTWLGPSAALLGALVLVALALGFVPPPGSRPRLPSWDIRRREAERREAARRRGDERRHAGRPPGPGSRRR